MEPTLRITLCRIAMALGVAAGLSALSGCGGPLRADDSGLMGGKPGQYVFWPPFPAEPRVQFIRSFGSSSDLSTSKAGGLERLVFGKEVEGAQNINKPYGVAMRDGKIYVCDIRNASVTVLDLRKKQTRLMGVSGKGTLSRPVAVAIADDGAIYVADNERGAVLAYDNNERYTHIFGHDGLKPAAVAVYGDRLYVSDTASQIIEIYNRNDGRQIGSIGTVGDEDGQFRLPLGIASDDQGNIAVVDMMLARVQRFGPDGTLLSKHGSLGDYTGAFARPKHIAVDRDGIQYVVDAAFQNVQMFDAGNALLMHFGAAGSFPGAMNLPAGVCVSDEALDLVRDQVHPGFEPRRYIVVTNQFGNDKVSLYVLGALRDGYTAQDIASASLPISEGVGTPSAEQLRIQSPGDEEPLPDPTPTPTPTPTSTPTPPPPPPPPPPAPPLPKGTGQVE